MRMVLGTLLAVVGLVWVGVGAFDWDWVIKSANNRLFLSLLGRTGTRIFYLAGGAALAVVGILYALQII